MRTLLAMMFALLPLNVAADQPTPILSPSPSSVTPPETDHSKSSYCKNRFYVPSRAVIKPSATIISMEVDVDGAVKNVTVEQSSGDLILDKAAVDCVSSSWHFKPAIQNGQPVAGTKKVKILWNQGPPP